MKDAANSSAKSADARKTAEALTSQHRDYLDLDLDLNLHTGLSLPLLLPDLNHPPSLRHPYFIQAKYTRNNGRHQQPPRMAASIYFPQRTNGSLTDKSHHTNGHGLPIYNGSSSAVQEKWQRHKHSSSWLIPITLPIPGVRTRRLRLMAPNPTRIHQLTVTRFGRTRGSILLIAVVIAAIYTVFALHRRFATEDKTWPTPFPVGEPPTLVYRREDLQRIWEWEVAAGHYPSSQKSE